MIPIEEIQAVVDARYSGDFSPILPKLINLIERAEAGEFPVGNGIEASIAELNSYGPDGCL